MKYRHIPVMDFSQPKECSLKVDNSRSNIMHCARLLKYNTLETCQVFLLGKKKLVWAVEKKTYWNWYSANNDVSESFGSYLHIPRGDAKYHSGYVKCSSTCSLVGLWWQKWQIQGFRQ